MTPDGRNDRFATALVAILAILAVLYGIYIAQHLLLGAVTALLVVLTYIAWRFLREYERRNDKNHQFNG